MGGPRGDSWPHSDMCPFIPSDLPGGIPYSVGASLCSHGNGRQPAGQAPSVPSVWCPGLNPSLGLLGAVGLPRAPLRTAGMNGSFAEHGGGSGLGDSLASSFPSKCFKRQRLGIKKEPLCGGILRKLCKFLHLGAVCLSFLSLDSPKQLVASRGGELSHACNALAPKGCLGNIFLCSGWVNGSAEQEPSLAANPEAMPWVAGLVIQTRRRTCWGQRSKRQPQWGCCGSSRGRGAGMA